MGEMYDNSKHLEDTFTESNLSEYLLQAQYAELVELKNAIDQIQKALSRNISLLDIWVWDARIVKRLSWIREIREILEQYHGIDISQNCVDETNRVVEDLWLQHKVKTRLLDASHLDELNDTYDLIITTRFTAGNFYPRNFSFENFISWSFDLSVNDKFTQIFAHAYNKLNAWWEIIIGSIYVDNVWTREKQEDSYRNFWWNVITGEGDSFTASDAGWWSQRFTEQRVRDYLSFIPEEKISFIPLDTYDYAMMVRIKK